MKTSMINIDNFFGLILAILIVFEFNVENDMKVILNTYYGIAISLVLVVITFIFMNPIVGLLLVIYLYENVKLDNLTLFNIPIKERQKKRIMDMLNNNPMHSFNEFEHQIIKDKAPLVRVVENPNSNFIPNSDDNIPFSQL